MIEIKDITKAYEETIALKNIELDIQEGDCFWFARYKWGRKEHIAPNDCRCIKS